jgi:hypothetical protein
LHLARDLSWLIEVVTRQKTDILAAPAQQAPIGVAGRPKVLLPENRHQPWSPLSRHSANDLRRRIPRGIVGDDHFGVVVILRQRARQRLLDVALLVVGGDNDRDERPIHQDR